MAMVWDGRVRSCPRGERREGREVGQGLRGGSGGKRGKGNKGSYRLRIGSWNVGTLTGKSIELAKILQKRRVNIACVQETRWVGSTANDADGYKLWYSGVERGGYGEVHGGFSFGERNGEGTMLLDFAKAFGLVIMNSRFSKRNEHLVTFQNAVAKTHINYLLLRRCESGLCKDCKVIPGETLATQHKLLVIDVGIKLKRRKLIARGTPRIRWGALTKDKAQELEWRLSAMGAWRSSGDANTMW
uniref:Uncharacterized protein LOC104215629 n=1 Tax=Nicotiana sylvestris TaxID=4096 RepID=A0A1U7VPF8_NICSY|nr:PREDICTED: uncharacterized protein LOC104215629 [Nicotiana sylvestris]